MKLSLKQRFLRGLGHQLWLPGRDRLLRLFVNPDTHPSVSVECSLFGIPYVGNLNNFIDWTVFYSGAYARHELFLLRDIAAAIHNQGKPVNFFDVGANIGHHTLFMSKYVDKVFAFEPFGLVREQMERKISHAKLNNVSVLPVALGDEDQTGTYQPPVGCNQGTGTIIHEVTGSSFQETIPVQVVRGDEYLVSNGLPHISLVKMDVEGYEAKVLAGLQKTLARDRPPILVEIMHDTVTRTDKTRIAQLKEVIYRDHLMLTVASTRRGQYLLRPFLSVRSDEVLILPSEMAGLLPGLQGLSPRTKR